MARFINNNKQLRYMAKKVVIGADHAGLFLKEKVKQYLKKKKIDFEDVGAYSLDKNDDYPDFALKVAKKVKQTGGRGLLLCGSGTGMAVAANKFRGIRAVVGVNEDEVYLARKHNDVNVLCLNGVDYTGIREKLRGNKRLNDLNLKHTSFKKTAKMINIFLTTRFEGGRHKRRLKKIAKIESM